MSVAGFITILCHRFKQPIVLGYILAGIIIGPYTPPFSFISDELTIKTLAELGVIFLMFSLGLEFNLHKLSRVGVAVFIAALAEIVLMMWLGYEIGRLFKWEKIDALFLGAILSISSTTIIVKALNELGLKKEYFAQLIFGILIVEDIFAILILTLLSSIALTGSLRIEDVLLNAAQLSSFFVVSLLLGVLLIPKLIGYIAKFNSDEMLLISVLGICFGFCLLVVKLDYSVALGAFIIGAVIAESKHMHRIEHLINPLRDMFSAIFFVSVGLLFQPSVLFEYFVPIVVIVIVVILGKVITCTLGLLATGQDGKTAVKTGMGLAQIGEFSFIIAGLGITLNVTSDFLYPMAVTISAITTLLTPYLIRYSDQVTDGIKVIVPKRAVMIFSLYRTWLQHIQPKSEDKVLRSVVKRSLLQVVINLFVIMAIFLGGAYIANSKLGDLLLVIGDKGLQQTLIWGAAFILSIPFLIANYRKMKALSMILAELSVSETMGSALSLNVRKVISELIPILSLVLSMGFVFAFSAGILPPMRLMIMILILAAILAVFLFPWWVKLHARLQINLLETLKENEPKGQ